MGWFWADETPHATTSAPARTAVREPPPSCPMHKKTPSPTPAKNDATSRACPYNPPSSLASSSTPTEAPSYISRLNPLNYMPENLSNARDASSRQSIALPLDREASTIPRGDGAGTWEYPSPQQMYNAMLRKGYTDTPAEHVESMVAVHNFLNEGAWEEIRGWEGRFAKGLLAGWERCRRGEEGYARQVTLDALRRRSRRPAADEDEAEDDAEPKLVRFEGRPSEPTPKARLMGLLARVYPSQFPDNPPFDRHDWYVQRQLPGGQTSEVRYVIDYYSGPPEPTGEPVFFLDVRPAVDGPTAACERLLRWGGDVWWRASGASVREEAARAAKRH